MNTLPPPHPTDQILYDYGLGKLGDPDASAVDSHLEACDACRQRVSELSGDSFVGRLRDAGGRPDAPAPSAALGPPPSGGPKAPALAGTLPPELAENPQYEILRELGRGGMGVVYLARNKLMDRLEVLKVLNKEMLERKGTYDRFLREVRAAARLAHPNVVGAYSAVQVGHLLVFAMEYVEGYDLSQLVKSRGPLPVAKACYFVHQAALGLEHAHERGMVHRDIKPGNLMLMRQGQRGIIKILDFGLAKASSENPIDGGLTREGQMLGTPHYISPEQTVDAQNADIRADIYSLGCTLYYLLTGGPPFDGKSLLDILTGHQSMEARPLNLVRPEVPVELAAVVGKMMAKDRERRYQTPAEVAEALKPFFKPKAVGSGSSDEERSGPGQQDLERTSAEVVPPASEAAGVALVAAPGVAAAPTDPASMWKGLVAIEESDHLSDARPPAPEELRGRPPWLGPALAIGIVLLGLVVGWAAGVFKFKTEQERHVTIPSPPIPPPPAPPPDISGSTPDKVEPAPSPVPRPEPPIEPKLITNSIGMKLVLIPAGELLMGSPDSDKDAAADEKPQHRVRIAWPFYLGMTEVTQGQYRKVMGQNPSRFQGADDLPVERVSADDATEFCAKLSAREGVSYRLPTEAEWEYACRAGSTTRYSFGDDEASLGEVAWYNGNSGNRTHPVGQKPPNAWGLYDMHGNLREWCAWYHKNYHGRSPSADPLGPSQAAFRAARGGSWDNDPQHCRSAVRRWRTPIRRPATEGFRVARVQSGG
jgi:formylglycine-generating enzyme required for sulfatase activity/tRNA A-37 threonylcarbamoyl transferase component Bud32